MPVIVVDIDNCISEDLWRRPDINFRTKDPFQRYHNYHLLAPFDYPKNQSLIDERIGIHNAPLIVVTGRPDYYRRSTERWLELHFGWRVLNLFMRADNDLRPSKNVKRDILHKLLRSGPIKIVEAYDDLPEIVEMYKTDFNIDARLLQIDSLDGYYDTSERHLGRDGRDLHQAE